MAFPAAPAPRSSLSTIAAAAWLAAAAAVLVTGCGGAAAGGAKAGETAPADAADTSLDPAAELDRAEREITALFGPAPDAPAASASPAAERPAPGPTPPAAPPPDTVQDLTPAGRTLSAESPPADPCAVACRALASMERAANHLCDLSGEAEPTCTSARERVKNASSRVAARCACGR